jgi:putative two-component system response regulator
MNQPPSSGKGSVMVVDDTLANLQLLAEMLKDHGYEARPVSSGKVALRAAAHEPPDLILLDISMPDLDGYEVCRCLKADPRLAPIPVIFISAHNETLDKTRAFTCGGVDYVTKPVQFEELEARLETHLKIRRLQAALDLHNQDLEQLVQAQVREISESQLATIMALARLTESRDLDTGQHLLRVQRYCKVLAGQLAAEGVFEDQIDADFIHNIFYASVLHDIGKVGIPDAVLLKPGGLSPAETEVIRRHTVLGAETLAAVVGSYPNNRFIRMGMEIARSHHECWDGSGYPDGLLGEQIPLSARIVGLADRYDALQRSRIYKDAFGSERSYEILTLGDGRIMPEHIDPRVMDAFKTTAGVFESIFQETLNQQPGRN